MCPLVFSLKEVKEFEVKVCVTAQHREMLDQVLDVFQIKPDFDLDLMKPNQDLYDLTSSILLGIKKVLVEYQPQLVLVHGDTTTTLATSLASFYQKIPVGHVEAGLRTGNIYSPWPEEINRKVAGQIAKFHFAPTSTSESNLLKEGISQNNIFVTGNTVIDAVQIVAEKLKMDKVFFSKVRQDLEECFQETTYSPEQLQTSQHRKFVLITGHRRENFGQGFENICEALNEIAHQNPDVDLIYPVHLNPNVKNIVMKMLGGVKNIFLVKPMKYESFIYLMNKCYLVITDSGGIQEEAPGLGKPVLVMRDTTERPEAVKAGTVKLTGTDKRQIVAETTRLLKDEASYMLMAKAHNPYGDGQACRRIAEHIRQTLLR